ncbi:hypothetical protein BDZ89DRAFT_1050858 [Hymenopellis radicata]|nr:hypothetical protein BDZ89DRAFT_1050858 [Hymenopellis radicata]
MTAAPSSTSRMKYSSASGCSKFAAAINESTILRGNSGAVASVPESGFTNCGAGGCKDKKKGPFCATVLEFVIGIAFVPSSLCWLAEAFGKPAMEVGLRSGGTKSIDAFPAPYGHRAGRSTV